MTVEATIKALGSLRDHHEKLEKKIADAARVVIPVLLDAGRANSAKQLQELFFEYDALDQEMNEFVERNAMDVLAALQSTIKKDGPPR